MTDAVPSAIVKGTCPGGNVRVREPREVTWSVRLGHSNPEGGDLKSPEHQSNLASRRSFLLTGAALGAGTLGAGRFLADAPLAFASDGLARGDVAILRFLAAA